MKKARISTETYRYGRDYLIDVVTLKDDYEAWIYRRDYGTKELMFGMPKSQQTYEYFLELVEANAPDHARSYLAEMEFQEEARCAAYAGQA